MATDDTTLPPPVSLGCVTGVVGVVYQSCNMVTSVCHVDMLTC